MGVLNLMLVNADSDPRKLSSQLDHHVPMNRDITFFSPMIDDPIGSTTHIKTTSFRRGGDRPYTSRRTTFDWWINMDACTCLGQRVVA